MLKNHPKGLLVAFFANMGERFGFYTMMAILVLFLQAKYGLAAEKAGDIYSWFYFSIYALALVGGILADSTRKYKTVILFGIVIMFAGYLLMAVPGMPLAFTLIALFTIAFGNGLFKGNLQAVVGQMYDDPKYSKLRDSAFMIFYMGINIGAFFAPFAASAMRNWWLKVNGFAHDGSLPALCHQMINGQLTDTAQLQLLANTVSLTGPVTDLTAFANKYLEVFAKGYNYAFGIAAGAMVISLLVYIFFNKFLPNKEKAAKDQKSEIQFNSKHFISSIGVLIGAGIIISFILMWATKSEFIKVVANGMAFGLLAGFITWMLLTARKEEYPRVSALILVFLVVIFFWMSFHQNGLTLTLFARDYTVKQVDPITNLFFTMPSLLSVIGLIAGLFLILRKRSIMSTRILGSILSITAIWLIFFFTAGIDPTGLLSKLFTTFSAKNSISPEIFQSFNPLFIVSLTFLVMGIFTWLNNKGKEPSTPKKIGIGMVIASVGFILVMIASVKLTSPHALAGKPVADAERVSTYWLISSYLILTVAELFLSPMGLSFVSKVAPSRFQGLMQGGWLLATAVGNKLLFVGTIMWDRVELWQLWLVFIVCCLLAATFIFSILKKLDSASK